MIHEYKGQEYDVHEYFGPVSRTWLYSVDREVYFTTPDAAVDAYLRKKAFWAKYAAERASEGKKRA